MSEYPILSQRLRRVLNELEDLTDKMEKLESDPLIPFNKTSVPIKNDKDETSDRT